MPWAKQRQGVQWNEKGSKQQPPLGLPVREAWVWIRVTAVISRELCPDPADVTWVLVLHWAGCWTRLLRDCGVLGLALHHDLAADREEHKQFCSCNLNSYWILLLSKIVKGGQKREKRGICVLSSFLLGNSNKTAELLTAELNHLCITSIKRQWDKKICWVQLSRHLKCLSYSWILYILGGLWYVC